MDYTLEKGNCRMTVNGCRKNSNQMLSVHDWLADIAVDRESCQYIEVQFKNTRKGFYLNSNNLQLEKGDLVAVESNPGHDIGTVTLQGYLVALQMQKNGFDPQKNEVKRVYRKAKQADLDKWEESKAKEHDAMLRSRKIAQDLHLDMKIGDVEYQGAAGHKNLVIELKYDGTTPVIRELHRVSKPGRRIYTAAQEIPRYYNGLGVTIVSTPQGVMDDQAAREANVGGEVLCQIF